jgi:hypothetical protein
MLCLFAYNKMRANYFNMKMRDFRSGMNRYFIGLIKEVGFNYNPIIFNSIDKKLQE